MISTKKANYFVKKFFFLTFYCNFATCEHTYTEKTEIKHTASKTTEPIRHQLLTAYMPCNDEHTGALFRFSNHQILNLMIGVFDSGYGGLTILDSIRRRLPDHDYLYLGDNARNPYGSRSYEVVYKYTLQGVEYLFSQGCKLVILACNTASAEALRTIQQHDLPDIDPDKRVLGVIRPTAEVAGRLTQNNHIGILATQGTVQSESYIIEIHKLYPNIHVVQQACPLWVPLIENKEYATDGAMYFIEKYLSELRDKDPLTDTVILACTHYPIIKQHIEKAAKKIWGEHSTPLFVAQGDIVAESLENYLLRHPDIDKHATVSCRDYAGSYHTTTYLTTENPDKFNNMAGLFLSESVQAQQVTLI